MIKKIFGILFWIILIGIVIIWIIDFKNIKAQRNPQFCIQKQKNVEVEYNNTTFNVTKCVGLGYAAYYSDYYHAFQPVFNDLEK